MRLPHLALPAVLLLVAATAACGADERASEPTTTTCDYPPADTPPVEPVEPPSQRAQSEGEAAVTMSTTVGEIGLTLDMGAAPCAVHSFVSLAEQGYFDGSPCHRLTTAASGIFVLQCGDPTGRGDGGPGYTFADELTGDETYPAGTVAMANAGPDTNGSQFFLVYEDTPLDPDYTVFGTLDQAGLDAVRDVADEGVQGGAPDGPPATDVLVESVTVD